MNTKLLKSFLKDQVGNSIAYFAGCFLIGLFYYIDGQKKIEILYPLSIILFVYMIWMLCQFVEYRKLYKDLEDRINHQQYKGDYHLTINQKVNTAINKIHSEYQNKLSDAEMKWKKERRFLSLWIHNMKTPVSVTDLIIQRMEQDDIDKKTGIQAMKEENHKLLTNLDTVLNMIRLEDFAKDYIPEQIDLFKELNAIINKNKSLFIYHHVFPKIVSELEKAEILSDKKWNELMLHQFISNAVKYSTDENGASKNIYFIVEKRKDKIILTIKDEGIGIPEHDLFKVWEPFFTGDNGRKGYQSSGIGLYFCSEVGKLLGHDLKLTSEVGKGTSVSISYLAKL